VTASEASASPAGAPAKRAAPVAASGRRAATGGAAGRIARTSAREPGSMRVLLAACGALVVALAVWFFTSGDPEEVIKAEAPKIVASRDLSTLPELASLEATSEGEWATMSELAARYVQPPFGPLSVQAGDRLMSRGRASVPAILNAFKTLDLTTEAGADIGWKVQTLLLQGLCKDTNFGWRRGTAPEDVAANKEVIARWFEAWQSAGDDDALWTEIAATKTIPPKPLRDESVESGAPSEPTSEDAE
jgi:hypothetical protein